jgi:hypothetical protein
VNPTGSSSPKGQSRGRVYLAVWTADSAVSSPETRFQAKATCAGRVERSPFDSITFTP